jgi:hypothetical protein
MIQPNANDSPELLNMITKAIKIEEDLQKDTKIKSSSLGRYYYCLGTIHQGRS